MSVLVDRDVTTAMIRGEIVVDPFDANCLGTNSYDVHLSDTLRVYRPEPSYTDDPTAGRVVDEHDVPLDVRVPRATIDIKIPSEGYVLRPGELYLASTVEYTESNAHLPILNGKSSVGRLGLSIHVTAGTGDVGFKGHWTMELFVIKPLRVYAGMAIGQLLWFTANEPHVRYDQKGSAKYNNRDPKPMASKLYQEHAKSEE